MKLETIIKKGISDVWNETPDVQIIETQLGKIVNINYDECKICIDRIYNLIGENMHVFVRLPHCDIHFPDLEELFDIVYHSNLQFHKLNAKGNQNAKSKNNKSTDKTTQPKVHKVLCGS